MKKRKLLLGITLGILSLFSLTSCSMFSKFFDNPYISGSSSTSKDEYTLTFNTEGGSNVSSIKVKSGEKASKPADPKRTGCVFGGWYTTYTYEQEFDFNTEITSSKTLYARWISSASITGITTTSEVRDNGIILYVTMTNNTGFDLYKLDGLNIVIKDSSNNYTCAAGNFDFASTLYYDNGRTNYKYSYFKNETTIESFGFFFDTTCCDLTYWKNKTFEYVVNYKYDAVVLANELTPVEKPTTTQTTPSTTSSTTTPTTSRTSTSTRTTTSATTQYTVTFNTEGGSTPTSVKVNSGSKVNKPADPTRAGCTFAGWYTSYTYTTEFDFNTNITSNKTLYAMWIVNNKSVTVSASTKKYTDGVSLICNITNNTGYDIYKLLNLRITIKNSSTNYQCADAYFDFGPSQYRTGYSYSYFKNGTTISNFDFFFNTSCCDLSYWRNNTFNYEYNISYYIIVCPNELK